MYLQKVDLRFQKAKFYEEIYRMHFTFLGNPKIFCNRELEQKVVAILERALMDWGTV